MRRRRKAGGQGPGVLLVEADQARIALRGRQEVIGGEGLQRVLHGQPAARGGDRSRVGGIGRTGRGQRVEQFVHQHRRRQRATVAHAAPDAGQVQHLARRQQHVEEQVAVVEPTLAVAALGSCGHEVEFGRAVAAWKGAMIHPDHAHHPIGQAAQCRQRGESDRAARHAAARRIVEQRRQRGMDDFQRHRRGQVAAGHRVRQRGDGGTHFTQVVGPIHAVAHQRVERLAQCAAPACCVMRAPQAVAQRAQGLRIAPEAAEGERGIALRRRGADAPGQRCHLRGVAGGPGEVEAVQALVQSMTGGPGVLSARRVMREAPADAGGTHPVVHRLQRRLVQPEPCRHRRLLQQVEDPARRQAAGQQRQQAVQHLRHRVLTRAAEAGDAPGDATPGGRGAEHRLDQRRGGVEVGREHDDVVRARRVAPGEQPQEPIVQHFQLARARMADVQLDAAIALGQRHAARLELLQVEDGVVQPRQQVASGMRREHRLLVDDVLALEQQPEVRLRLLPPGRQQAVAGFVEHVLLAAREPGQAARIDDLEPVLATGIERVQAHLHHPRQLAQHVQVERRQGRQAEHMHRARHAGGRQPVFAHGADAAQEERGRMLFAQMQAGADAPPQLGLPGFVGALDFARPALQRRPALDPQRQPARPVGQVMVEHARDAPGQLEAHRRIRPLQVGRQPRVRRQPAVGGRTFQQAMDAPGEQRRREGRALGHVHHTAHLRPQPLRQVGEVEVGTHALARGQRQLDAATQGAAGHHHTAHAKRPGLLVAKAVEQHVEEDFEAIREGEMEHRRGAC